MCETNKVKGCVSALTFTNIVYILRKELSPEKVDDVLKKLSLIFEFCDLSVTDIFRASEMMWNDFEDAIQSATALRLNADYIITRNVKNFNKSRVMALTPTEFLNRI